MASQNHNLSDVLAQTQGLIDGAQFMRDELERLPHNSARRTPLLARVDNYIASLHEAKDALDEAQGRLNAIFG